MADLQAEVARIEAETTLDEFEALIRYFIDHWDRASAIQAASPPECVAAYRQKTTDPREALLGQVAALAVIHPDVIAFYRRKISVWLEVVRLMRVAVQEDDAMRRTMEACGRVLLAASASMGTAPERVVHEEQSPPVVLVKGGVGGNGVGNGHAHGRVRRVVTEVLRQRPWRQT
ncbi:MAG TPA: hypothetical protein VGB14_01775 [Acidimicrobiales bacterium]|jgi:hypothetical protein